MRSVAERFAPGYGTAAAVAVGAGTLLLPYATMYYAHVPAAALAFAAYALLLKDRPLPAGLCAGLAVVVEYPAAFVALVLALWCRSPRFVLGAAIGGLPLPVYNLLTFGSLTHMSYDDVVGFEGQEEGLFGISLPDPGVAWDLLFAPTGLLVMTPLVAAGVWGLWRASSRVPLAIVALVFLYNAAYYLPFGGEGAGPRFLVLALPFLVIGVAIALREQRATTLALAGASVVGMIAATITEPQIENYDTSQWFDLLADGELQYTVAGAAGAGRGWLGMVPFLALVGLAIASAVRTMPPTALSLSASRGDRHGLGGGRSSGRRRAGADRHGCVGGAGRDGLREPPPASRIAPVAHGSDHLLERAREPLNRDGCGEGRAGVEQRDLDVTVFQPADERRGEEEPRRPGRGRSRGGRPWAT